MRRVATPRDPRASGEQVMADSDHGRSWADHATIVGRVASILGGSRPCVVRSLKTKKGPTDMADPFDLK